MFFGNNQGILEYDGASWRLTLVSNETTVRSLAIDSNGIIYVGAQGEIGYLQPDSNGNLKYRSLNNLVPEKERKFEDVWTCYATNTGIYFQSSQKIFCYRNHVIKTWDAKDTLTFHKMFYLYNNLFVRQRYVGLLELKDDRLTLIPGGEVFANEKIYFMSPFIDSSNNKILLNNGYRGLYIMEFPDGNNPGCKLTPFQTDIDPFFFRYKVYNEINLSNKFFQ